MKSKHQILLDEVRQIFASVVWTHKIQEKQADIYAKNYKILEMINILLAAATSCGIITTMFINENIAKMIASCLSFGTLFITLYCKSFDLKSMEEHHRKAAKQFLVIRNRLLNLISELHMKSNLDKINTEYQVVKEDLNNLFVNAPSTTDIAVRKAEKALNIKNEYTYTDEEIDHFLPPGLKGGIQ